MAATSTAQSNSGAFYLELFENNGPSSVTQTISAILGQTYDFSFFAMTTQTDATQNILSYSLDGGATTTITRKSSPTEFTDTFVASGSSADVTFFFSTAAGTGVWAVDDVSVFAAAAVPLPATAPMLLAALGGIWRLRSRRKT